MCSRRCLRSNAADESAEAIMGGVRWTTGAEVKSGGSQESARVVVDVIAGMAVQEK